MFTKLKWAIGGVLFISGTAHAWYSDNIDLKKFPQAVVENKEFAASPAPRLKEVKYSDRVIAVERMNASVVEEKLSYIKFSNANPENTGEDDKLKSSKLAAKKAGENLVPSGTESYGTSTSTLGGLFTLSVVSNEVITNTFKAKSVSKAVKEISGISGSLFPLNVGNALFFSYTQQDDSSKYGATFEVIKKTSAQQFAKEHPEAKDLSLIGDIYVIEQEIKSTKEDYRSEPCELYYADELSYIIGSTCKEKNQWVKSYKLNHVGAAYHTEIVEQIKAREKEDIDKKKQISAQLSAETKAKSKEKFSQAFNLFKEGEFEAAVIRFKQGLEFDPANGLGHFYLAETYARLNDVENSAIHYNYTLLLSPDIKEAAIAEVKLSKIREAQNKPQN